MNLSADLIYERLSEKYEVTYYGRDARLILHNILFYNPERETRRGNIYLVRGGMDLTAAADAGQSEDCLFIFVSGGGTVPDREEGSPVLRMKKREDIFEISNDLWGIFDYYTEWDRALENISHSDAGIAALLLRSAPVLGNPLAVVNSRMELLGAVWYAPPGSSAGEENVIPERRLPCAEMPSGLTDREESPWFLIDLQTVPLAYADRLRLLDGDASRTRQPFLNHDEGCERVYGVNLFIQDSYAGSLSMTEVCRPFTQARCELLQYLAGYIEKFAYYRAYENRVHITPIKQMLLDILAGGNTGDDRPAQQIREFFGLEKVPDGWQLAVLRPDAGKLSSPEYLISAIADMIDPSISFSYKGEIATLICYPDSDRAIRELQRLLPLTEGLGMHIGLSDPFAGLTDLELAYRKAACAIESGCGMKRENEVFLFTEYLFPYMLHHACGRFDAEELLSPGLRRLLDHDAGKDVSYMETLRCYLENDRNMLRTSRQLYLHRSSLEQRMEHIFELLGSRLEDPDERLYLMMILRVMKNRQRAGRSRGGAEEREEKEEGEERNKIDKREEGGQYDFL